MKILVTVGTGRFDRLVEAFDRRQDERVFIQFGTGRVPSQNACASFIPSLNNRLVEFDFVVSHAGAGTVYNLLSAGIAFCVAPNFDRRESHQEEISNYLKREALAPVVDLANDLIDIDSLYLEALRMCKNTRYPGPSFDFNLFEEHNLKT